MKQEKKFKLSQDPQDIINVDGHQLHRIIALKDIRLGVEKGHKGGFVESEKNLNHYDKGWVDDDGMVYGKAKVSDWGLVCGNAVVKDNAQVNDGTWVDENAVVKDNAELRDEAYVKGYAVVGDNAKISGNAVIMDNAIVKGNAEIYDDATIRGNSIVGGNTKIYDEARVTDDAVLIGQDLRINGRSIISGKSVLETGAYADCRIYQAASGKAEDRVKGLAI